MTNYDVECECCGDVVTISGGYIGHLDDVYCEDCGYSMDNCDGVCQDKTYSEKLQDH